MLLSTAQRWASKIAAELQPLCGRIRAAGSVRRMAPLCGDLDFVCLATPEQRRAVRSRCLRNHPEVRADGEQILSLVLPNGIRIQLNFARPETADLFGVTPSNWGSIFLCRTGPLEFNRAICLRAARMGYHWNPFKGVTDHGEVIAAATEHAIFRVLDLSPIPPPQRDRVHSIDDRLIA
jgi:DNA polymerase/3'-5' exonuclease PolX